MKIFHGFVFSMLLSFLSVQIVQAQTVSLGADTTLPCNVNCLNLTATLTARYATTSYTIDSTALAFSTHPSFTGGSTTSIPTTDDKFSGVISLPFNFCFYGMTYSSVLIGSNGIISFDASQANGSCHYTIPYTIPNSYYYPPSILGAYHDINPATGGSINYYTIGTAPNRRFVVNYSAIPHFSISCFGYVSTFQIVLNETSNNIDVFIQDKPSCSNWNSGLAISGIENSGTVGMALPGKNATVWGSTGMNKFYRFAPSAPPTVQLLNSSNVVISTVTPTISGTQLTAIFPNICPTTDTSVYRAKITYAACPGNLVVYDTIVVRKFKTPKPIVTSPINLCQSGATTALTATGQNILWYTSATGGTGSATAPIPNTATVGTQVYYVSQTINGCESLRDSIVVNIIPTTAPIANSNSPVCEGDSLKLFANTIAGVIYIWSGPNGFTDTTQNPQIPNAQNAMAGVYAVYTYSNGCPSPVDTTTVMINPKPTIASTTFTNPTTCGGNDGVISVHGLISGNNYTINYTQNGIAQTPIVQTAIGGTIDINNLIAANYNNITVMLNGCTSLPIGPIILNSPSAPATPTLSSNSPLCVGDTLLLSASNVAGATYTWTGPNSFSSSVQNPFIANAQTLHSGVYTVTATLNNCTAAPGVVTVVIHPIPSSPIASSNSAICEGDTLKLFVSTVAGATYTWSGSNSFSSTTQNPIISNVTTIASGIYNVTVTANGCTSAMDTTTVLVYPIPSAPIISSNSPVCEGDSIKLSTPTIAGTTYTWTGINGFSAGIQNPSIANAQMVNAGMYSLTTTINNCTSPSSNTNVVVNSLPSILATNYSNPTTCGGADGTITLLGGVAGTSYIVAYTKNGIAQATQTITANASGNIIITTLSAGSYADFTITLNGCTSAPFGSVTLTNPLPPAAPAISATSPVCVGDSIHLFTSLVAGATYTWTGPNSFTSSVQNPSLANATSAMAGVYSLTLSTYNCTSAASTVSVVVNPLPAMPVASSNSPVCNNDTINLTASTIAGATYVWSGVNGFASTQQNPTLNNATAINTGVYAVFAIVNGCSSLIDTTTVIINSTPVITSSPFSNPTGCGFTDGTITLSGLQPSTVYTLSYSKNGTPQTTITLSSNASGDIVLLNLSAGSYNNFVITLNGCSGMYAGVIVLSNPNAPSTPTVNNNGPICAGTTLNLNATTALVGTSYTWTGPNGFTSSLQNPSIANAQLIHAGVYTLTLTYNNCTSTPASTTVVVNPLPSTPVLSSNSPVCSGNSINLSTTSTTGAGYTWTGPNGFTSSLQNPSITNASSVNSGTYSVFATLSGCNSANASIVVTVNPTPIISNTSFINPSGCGMSNGSITLYGLTAATIYNLVFTKNGITQPAVIVTANASGSIVLTGLSAGNYSGFSLSLNGCTGIYTSTISLVEPPVPATPVISSNSPLCVGAILNLSSTATTAGASYTWTGPNGFTSSLQNPTITNVQTTHAGVYTLIVSLNNCNATPVSTTVVIYPIPVAPVVTSNSPVCSGSAINLSASSTSGASYSWTGPNSFSSSLQNPTILNAQNSNAGIYTVVANIANCVSPSSTVAIAINPQPVISSSSFTNPSICNATDGTISINGLQPNTTYSITYTKNSAPQAATNMTANSAGIIILTNLSAGSYTNITATLNGCSAIVPGPLLLINPGSPVAPTASNSSPICLGDTVQLFASSSITGAIFSWTGPAGFTSSLQNPILTNVQTAMAGSYSVTITINNCTSSPANTNVILFPTPTTPIISATTPICAGDTLQLTASSSSGATYTWTGPNSFSSTLANPSISNAQPTHSGIYTVVATLNGCVSKDTSIIVLINATPNPPIINNISYCQSTATQPLSAIGTNLLWYTSATGGIGIAVAPTPSSTTPGTTNWYVSQTVNGCESPRALLSVVITAKPSMPTVNNITYCEGATTTALTATGQNLLWYNVQTGGTGTPTAPIPSSLSVGVNYYYVSQTINSCESDRAVMVVSIIAKPTIPTVPASVSYCQGELAIPLTATGQNLLWYANANGGVGNAIAPVPNTNAVGTTNYYVTQTTNGCESDRAGIAVKIFDKAPASIMLSKLSVCQFDTISAYNNSMVTGAIYTWNFYGAKVQSGSGVGPYSISWSTAGNKKITLIVTNGNCVDSQTIYITVNPSPYAAFEMKPIGCINEIIKIDPMWTSSVIPVFNWNFAGATIIDGHEGTQYKLQWNTTGSKIVSLYLSTNGCGSQVFTDTIDIRPLPSAQFDVVSQGDICSGEFVQVNAKETGNGYTYLWQPTQYVETNGFDHARIQVFDQSVIKLAITDSYGCFGEDSILLQTKPCCLVSLPDVFSPNNDGLNDVFRIIKKGYHHLSVFRIVNRWGQTVFETTDENHGWDGSFKGTQQEIGTYFYYLRYKCDQQEIEKKGEVILLR